MSNSAIFNQRHDATANVPVEKPSSSIDYLYQAIALIEAKNSMHQKTNQYCFKLNESFCGQSTQPNNDSMLGTDYSRTIAAMTQNQINTKRLLGSFLYHQSVQNQQQPNHQSDLLMSPLFQQAMNVPFGENIPHANNFFNPPNVESCSSQLCSCKTAKGNLTEQSNVSKLTSRLEKAKEFARRANSTGGSSQNGSRVESSESCADSLYGSSQDDESKESSSPVSTTPDLTKPAVWTAPSPLAASSPIASFPFFGTSSQQISPPPASSTIPVLTQPPASTALNAGPTINPLDMLSNLLPVYLNSYLKTLSQSLANPIPPSTQDQVAYIQNLIDLINTVSSYQQQQRQIRTFYNTLASQRHQNNQQHSQWFQAASQQSDVSLLLPSHTSVPCNSESLSMSFNCLKPVPQQLKKDRTSVSKRKPSLPLKPTAKITKTKLNNRRASSHFSLNLYNFQHALTHSIPKNSPITCDKDVLSKVDEHFRRSLGNNYFKFVSQVDSQP